MDRPRPPLLLRLRLGGPCAGSRRRRGREPRLHHAPEHVTLARDLAACNNNNKSSNGVECPSAAPDRGGGRLMADDPVLALSHARATPAKPRAAFRTRGSDRWRRTPTMSVQRQGTSSPRVGRRALAGETVTRASSAAFLAFPEGVGSVCVLPLDQPGRLTGEPPLIRAHGDALTGLAFSRSMTTCWQRRPPTAQSLRQIPTGRRRWRPRGAGAHPGRQRPARGGHRVPIRRRRAFWPLPRGSTRAASPLRRAACVSCLPTRAPGPHHMGYSSPARRHHAGRREAPRRALRGVATPC